MDAVRSPESNDPGHLQRFVTTLFLSGHGIEKFLNNFERLHLDIVKFVVDILK